MDAQVVENVQQHRFELPIAGDMFAAAYYRLEGGKVALIHTEVPSDFPDKGSRRDWPKGPSNCSAKPAVKRS